ncbi:MAG: efflux RND transporter periplasmic adaptor subunit [Leptolyngbya sp. SIO1D8]|nr:efflux RND transporter periplasmic adaptor subunit [Leptolyngbya sp. SIO1D8]
MNFFWGGASQQSSSVLWPGTAFAVCLLGLSGCTTFWAGGNPLPEEAALAEELVAVDAITATIGSPEDALVYTGTTQPEQQVSLRARVDGQVTLLTVDVGDPVAAGDAIARLDADLLTVEVNQATAEFRARQSEVAQAHAAVSDAQTALETARVQLQQAQADANRLNRLASEGAISVQAAEQAQLAVETGQQVLRSAEEQIRTRQEAVNAAEGRVSAQQAIIDQAQERLSYAIVRSPLTGVVFSRFVETGDYVESGDELLQVGDLSRVKVMIEVSDQDLSQISLGQAVEVQFDAFPDQSLSGQITRIAPAADATSRLIPMEITVPNDARSIGSGLLARVRLQSGDRESITIPSSALELAEDGNNMTVFVVSAPTGQEATVEARTVTLGLQANDRVEILSGLQLGEVFVVRSSGPLRDGQSVRLSILSETPQSQEP